jgi:hypothetical protein
MLFSDNSWNALIHLFSLQTMQILIFTNMILMANRIVQRMIAVGRIYPVWVAVLSPARWPVGSVINGFAAINATFQFLKSLLTRSKIKWAKTTHELPIAFGKRSWAVEGESK